MPQRGDIDYDLIRSAARQGAGAQFQMFSGASPVSGHIAIYDGNGNVTDGGPPGASYVLPPATSAILGGVKIGANVSVAADGTISVAAPGGTPAGPANAVQYNNSGAFGGSSYLLWDNTGCTLNISSPAGLGNQGPGIAITDPDNSRSAQIYVNQVGLQIEAGSNTAMYLDSPNHGIQISAGGEVLFDSGATVGPAYQFETNASGSSLIILPNGYVGINQPSPQYQLGVVGDVNITGVYRINGTPISTGGQNQTPWLSDIQGANFNLHNAAGIGVGGSANNLYGVIAWGNYQTAGFMHSNSNSAGFAGFEAMGNVGGVAIGAYGSTAPNSPGTAIVASVNGIPLTFLTNAVERMRIAGNNAFVGIGNSSPQVALDVNGLIRSTQVTGYPSSGAGLEMYWYPGNSVGVVQAYDRTASAYQRIQIEANPLVLNLNSGANTGIGTATPHTTLEVFNGGTTVVNSIFGNNSAALGIVNNGSVPSLQGYTSTAAAAGTLIALNPGGGGVTVGMTTLSAFATLDVNGNIRASGQIEGDFTVACGIYYDGSNWRYRDNSSGLVFNQFAMYYTPPGSAGNVATVEPMIMFGPLSVGIQAAAGTTQDGNVAPNTGMWYTIAPTNTQLVFRMRGADGIYRQGTLNLA